LSLAEGAPRWRLRGDEALAERVRALLPGAGTA
jgi:hypothetical protein